jgi:hypothetical protein
MENDEEFGQQLRALEAKILKLSSQLEAMKAEAAKAAEPPKPRQPYVMEKIDFTEGMSMPRNALEAMVAAVPDHLVRALVNDHLHKPVQPPMIAPEPKTGSSGWAEPTKLRPPPGTEIVDRLVEEQDAIDKAELTQQLKGDGG